MKRYRKSDGTLDYVEIQNNNNGTFTPSIVSGTAVVINGLHYVLPQNLSNVGDFIGNWKPSWAEALIEYHPEYCYLEYTRAICEVTRNIDVLKYNDLNEVVSTEIDRPLNSDEYDAYLGYLDTYQKAFDAGFFNLGTPYGTQIFQEDPYFSGQLDSSVDNSVLFNWRRNLMLEALNTQYENYTLSSDGSGIGAKMIEVAVQMASCNAIETFNFNSSYFTSSLTPSQKDRLWNTYKSLYISLKGNIKHVFINMHAVSNGCYNGCIGNNGSNNILNVIANYNNQGIYDAISYHLTQNVPNLPSALPAFCNHPSAVNYANKEKRFIPTDFYYDSDATAQSAIDQLLTLGNYEYYSQTGNCPLINDLNLFLGDFFEELNLSTGASLNSTTHHIGQGFSAKLFKELTRQNTFPLASGTPQIYTSISGSELNFGMSPIAIGFAPPLQLNLTLPTGSTLSWSNYGINLSNWRIVGFSQLYYDAPSSNLTGTPPVFGFKVVARYTQNGIIKDIVLSGKTIARIGECHVEGDSDGVGEILTADSESCYKRELFANSLKDLINHLQAIGQVNNDYNISNDPVFTSGFLPTYFGINSGDVVEWRNSPMLMFRGIYINNIIWLQLNFLSVLNPYLVNNDSLLTLNIGPAFRYSNLNSLTPVNMTINSQGGIISETFNGNGDYSMIMLPRYGKRALYFSCCSPCGEWDHDGNGIGDLCDNQNEVSCNNSTEEILFEDNLKSVLNNFLQPGNHLTDGNGHYY
ncbi:MAG: hypothetical protein ACK4ON_03655, partial [Bacteroidia bacterium]